MVDQTGYDKTFSSSREYECLSLSQEIVDVSQALFGIDDVTMITSLDIVPRRGEAFSQVSERNALLELPWSKHFQVLFQLQHQTSS